MQIRRNLNSLQYIATHCNKLQHTATHCNTLQHTASHCRFGSNSIFQARCVCWKSRRRSGYDRFPIHVDIYVYTNTYAYIYAYIHIYIYIYIYIYMMYTTGSEKYFINRPDQIFKILSRGFYFPGSGPSHKIILYWFYYSTQLDCSFPPYQKVG